MRDEMRKRIEDRSVPEPNSGCWLWTKYCDKRGRAFSHYNGVGVSAARASYIAFVGVPADGMYVCHHCDNPACVNPDHLFLGTHADNMRDMSMKGRAPRGQARLVAWQVQEIRRRVVAGETQSSLANEFGVSQSAVSLAASGKTWRRVRSEGANG